jgi:hypothetical protein
MNQKNKIDKLEKVVMDKLGQGKWYKLAIGQDDTRTDNEIVETFCKEKNIVPSFVYKVPCFRSILHSIDGVPQLPKGSPSQLLYIQGSSIVALPKKERDLLNKYGFEVKFKP